MFEQLVSVAAADALARRQAALQDLAAIALHTLTEADLIALLREREAIARREVSLDHALIAELESRGTAHSHACPSTVSFLSQLLRITPHEADGRVKAAAELGPRRGLSGELLPPQYPAVAAAQAAGQISPTHARVITATITGLREEIRHQHHDFVQQALLTDALDYHPGHLAQIAQALAYALDQDGHAPSQDERHRRRQLRIRRRGDGSAQLSGELSALCAEALLSTLEPLAAPAPADAEGLADQRSAGQRLHDALNDALNMALRAKLLPDCGGFAATILLTMTAEQFATGDGLVRTGHGANIPMDEALTLFGDARIVPVVLGKTKEILAYGTSHRIFTEGQRLAMIARDQGCSFPACTRPPTLCQAHHITDYTITRRTCVNDGTLLCGYHHREHPRLGWTCQMINGTPHWTAPPWIDPTQTPRRNRAHHLLPV